MQLTASWKTASLSHMITAVKSRMRQVAGRRLAPYGLTPQQFQLLMAVAERDGRCHGDLARCTWMDKPTATRILRTLQDRGLVRAEGDPAHRRRVLFHLLPEAEALVQELRTFRQSMREGMEQGLDPKDRDRLRDILASVMGNLDRMDELDRMAQDQDQGPDLGQGRVGSTEGK
ncbi:MAG TPA: MarR family winged helix-turn-helix transcriptional regulator [Geothrix sp.]|uniref:MarR family winged helix-turn-helix transcriptional regulator n=1 Tax=Geothrix mesophila TaxID=2922723 RepID=UPI001FAD716B|nr:MarR family winged helix-turn-helix transcriptional regulator [Geothrix sp. SG198]HJV38431.1 MarR family winged helix-turn-helix transcriptional regulator [Geothrix sp.]